MKEQLVLNEKLSPWRWAVGGLLLSSALTLGLWGLSASEVLADRSENVERYESSRDHDDDRYNDREYPGAPLSMNATYQEECGSCHLAYPPGLLSAASWQAIMTGLDEHFGENAELGSDAQRELTQYLQRHGADPQRYQSQRYLSGTQQTTPPVRITQLPFFIREHDEIPERLVAGNEAVGSFSRCEACHAQAAQGRFDEDELVIPGFGRWDD